MSRTWGLLAEFTSPKALLAAADKVRSAGYRQFDCHSPFPIHGMDEAMGLERSPLGLIVGGLAALGATMGMGLQWWVSTVEYPLVIAGKPFFSWQAYIIITFALLVLFGAFGAVFGMLRLNRLPRLHHPLFESDNFAKVTTGGFFLSLESADEQFDEGSARELLESTGAVTIEVIKG